MPLEAIKSKQEKIFKKLEHFPEFYLAGGTALALQINHRVSVDFDLFSRKDIPATLLDKAKSIFPDLKVKVILNSSGQLSLLINQVKVDFIKYDFPLLTELVEFKGVKLASVSEIAAMKAYAVGRRGTLKDYVDLYFILREKYATLREIKKIAEKKYKSEFNFRLFLEQLVYLEDIKKEKIEFLKKEVSISCLHKFFVEEIKKLK